MTLGVNANYYNQYPQRFVDTINPGVRQPISFQAQQAQNAQLQAKLDNVADGKDDGSIGFLGALKNIGKGILNFGTSLLGFDADGNWSLGSFIKNAAIAVGIGAVCVLTAGTAVPAIIAAGGVALGGFSLAKGAVNVATAKTDAEAEAAWQQVGSGTAATALAVVGAKAVAKGMHAEEAAAGEFDGVSGTMNAVKTVFKDSGTAIKGSAEGIYEAASGASGVRGKFDAVKGEIGDQFGEFKATVESNYNKTVYGSKGKVANEAEQVGKEIEQVREQQSKITDTTSKEYKTLETKRAQLEAKKTGIEEINNKTSYRDAYETVENTKTKLKAKEAEAAKSTDPATKAQLQSEAEVLKARYKAQKSTLNRRSLEARALRDKIEANEAKMEKILESKNPNMEKYTKLKQQNAELAARQDFEIPTRTEAKAARTAQNEARISAKEAQKQLNNAQKEYELAENTETELAKYEELLNSNRINAEAQAKYKAAQQEAAKIGNFEYKYGNYANTASEVGRSIYNDPGAKWMTIYAATDNSPVSSETRFLSLLSPEQRQYYNSLPTEQRQALIDQFKIAA